MDADKLAEVTSLRFEGYTPGMLAVEVDAFHAGGGAGSFNDAFEALESISTALAKADDALREQLTKLGVEWEGVASEAAGEVVGERAEFAQTTKTKADTAAQTAILLRDAFNTAKNSLPDAETLRAGDGGLGFTDIVSGLIGHETGHAVKVRAARAARDQAIDALNTYQRTCATELAAIETLDAPEAIVLDDSSQSEPRPVLHPGIQTMASTAIDVGTPDDAEPAAPGASGRTGGIGGAGSGGPGAAECPPERSGTGTPTAAPTTSSTGSTTSESSTAPSTSTASGAAAGAASGAVVGGAVAAAPSGGSQPSARPQAPSTGSTAPSGAVVPPVAGGTASTGSAGSPTTARPGGQGGSGAPGSPSGNSAPGGGAGAPGSGAATGTPGEAARGFGGGAGKGTGAPGQGTAVPPGVGGGADALAKGRMTGTTPLPPAPGGNVGPAVTGPAPVAGTGGPAVAGAAAVGAAGVAGAASGERDKEHRGQEYGKDAVVDGRRLHDLDVGEIPDEQRARNAERLEPPHDAERPRYLEQAAPQGTGDEPRIRTHGIDDVDLFTDDRMVAREVIDGPAEQDGSASEGYGAEDEPR